jgi:signal peptidase I
MLSRRFMLVVLISLAAAWVLARLIKDSVIDVSRVSNESMLPYLQPGQRVLLSRLTPCLHLPFTGQSFWCRPCEVGQAYVFRHPHKTNMRLIKFAAAFRADTDSLRRDIMWFTDGNRASLATGSRAAPHDVKMTEQNACFFVGSNTDVSVDSRQFGPVPLELVQGKVLYPVVQMLPVQSPQQTR